MNQHEATERYLSARRLTESLCEPLEIEDYVVQPTEEVSPPKWHLGHTSWFFDNFILKEFLPSYKTYDEHYFYLFNSYYKSQGQHWVQKDRGTLSRPTVSEVYQYRKHVDEQMTQLLSNIDDEEFKKLQKILDVGIHHEQQHQELLLMDIKYILGHGPVKVPYLNEKSEHKDPPAAQFLKIEGGIIDIGISYDQNRFNYCNETPKHKVLIDDFELMNRPITNREYLDFINDGAYENPLLWKSDGWNYLNSNNDKSPLYWSKVEGQWFEYTLEGLHPIDLNRPLTHINFYEADAYAQWAGLRLPTEFELEHVYSSSSLDETAFFDFHKLGPTIETSHSGVFSLQGNLWEWTSSSYLPYPKYKRPAGAFGEYNQKFMINQKVLRGGSFATLKDHYRHTYRNFFYPEQKWAFDGIRPVKD